MEVTIMWTRYNRDMVGSFMGQRDKQEQEWYAKMVNKKVEEGWITKTLETPKKKKENVVSTVISDYMRRTDEEEDREKEGEKAEKEKQKEEERAKAVKRYGAFKKHFGMAADIMYMGIGEEIREELMENEEFSIALTLSDIDDMIQILKDKYQVEESMTKENMAGIIAEMVEDKYDGLDIDEHMQKQTGRAKKVKSLMESTEMRNKSSKKVVEEMMTVMTMRSMTHPTIARSYRDCVNISTVPDSMGAMIEKVKMVVAVGHPKVGGKERTHLTIDARIKYCTQWALTGKCVKGSECPNLHIEPDIAREDLQTSGRGGMMKPGVCFQFSKIGTCQYGDRCNFRHGEEEMRSGTGYKGKRGREENAHSEGTYKSQRKEPKEKIAWAIQPEHHGTRSQDIEEEIDREMQWREEQMRREQREVNNVAVEKEVGGGQQEENVCHVAVEDKKQRYYLDTCASVNTTDCREHIDGSTPYQGMIATTNMDDAEGVRIESEGQLCGVGRVVYAPRSEVKLIALSKVIDMRMKNGGRKYEVVLQTAGNSLKDAIMIRNNENGVMIYTKRDEQYHKFHYVEYAQLIELNKKATYKKMVERSWWTKEQTERAKEAHRMIHQNNGHNNLEHDCKMLDKGYIANNVYTSKDLRNYVEIFGECESCQAARAYKKSKRTTTTQPAEKVGDRWHLDIRILEDELAIMGVDEASKYIFYQTLKSGKRKQKVENAMDKLVELNHRYGHKIKTIRTDREAVFLACQANLHMQGVDTEETPIDGHTKSVERAIGVLNEKRKAKIQELLLRGIDMPAEFKRGILDKAMVQVMNTSAREEDGEDGRPPYEYLEGKKVDIKKHMQYSYGDIVWTTKAKAERDPMKGNAELGVVLYREMGVPGGYRVYIFGKMRALVRVPNKRTGSMDGVPERFRVREKKEREDEGRIEEEVMGCPETEGKNEEERDEEGELEDEDEIVTSDESDEMERRRVEEEAEEVKKRKEEKKVQQASEDKEKQREVEEEMKRRYSEKTARDKEEVKSKVYTTRRVTLTKRKKEKEKQERKERKEMKRKEKGQKEVVHMTIEKARQEYPETTDVTWQGELKQIVDKEVFMPAKWNERSYIERQTRTMRMFMMVTPKYDAQGAFIKLKARYNANPRTVKQQGWKGDNSSPTSTLEAIFISLHMAATRRKIVKTYDITGAFLHAWLKEGEKYWGIIQKELVPYVLTIQPELEVGRMPNGEMIVEIKKALYGLEESPKRFYEKLSSEIREIGYKSTVEDPCVMVKGSNKVFVARDVTNTVVTHVDDILVTFGDEEEKVKFEEMLKEKFNKYTESDIIDGPINFTGMTIQRDEENNIKVTQNKIVNDILEENNIEGKQKYPANENIFRVKKSEESLENKEAIKFLSTIMTLMYVGKRTRYDIMLPLSYLCTRVKNPTNEDQEKLNRIMEYLNETKNKGIIFRADASDQLSIYCDAGYNCHNDGKGHSGIIYKIGCNTIGIKSTKQKVVSRSSCEAELICIEMAVQEGMWIRNMAREMGVENNGRIEIYEDNKSAMILVQRGFSKVNRHLSNRYYYVHQKIMEGQVCMKYLKTEEHIADILTKGIIGNTFKTHVERTMEGGE